MRARPEEVRALRQAGVTAPIYLLGPVALDDLAEVAALEARLVVYNRATIERLAALGVRARLHLKVETGNHRQGRAARGAGARRAHRAHPRPGAGGRGEPLRQHRGHHRPPLRPLPARALRGGHRGPAGRWPHRLDAAHLQQRRGPALARKRF
ncbi:MAG: alanine racemase [bacterium]